MFINLYSTIGAQFGLLYICTYYTEEFQ